MTVMPHRSNRRQIFQYLWKWVQYAIIGISMALLVLTFALNQNMTFMRELESVDFVAFKCKIRGVLFERRIGGGPSRNMLVLDDSLRAFDDSNRMLFRGTFMFTPLDELLDEGSSYGNFLTTNLFNISFSRCGVDMNISRLVPGAFGLPFNLSGVSERHYVCVVYITDASIRSLATAALLAWTIRIILTKRRSAVRGFPFIRAST